MAGSGLDGTAGLTGLGTGSFGPGAPAVSLASATIDLPRQLRGAPMLSVDLYRGEDALRSDREQVLRCTW